MGIFTFSEGAVLGGVQSWLQYQGLQAVCQPQEQFDLRALAQWLTPGVKAQAGDSVRYSAFLASGSAVIDYGGQWMNEKGVYSRYNRTLNVTSGASPVRTIQPANAGWYRDAAVSLQTAAITGQTLYVTQELGRTNGGSFVPYAMLAQGWLTSTAPVSSTTQPPPDGGGLSGGGCCVTTQIFTGMPTGGNSSFVVLPEVTGKQIRLLVLITTLATAAGGANRLAQLSVTSASGGFYQVFATTPQPPSTSHGYQYQAGGERYVETISGTDFLPLPADTWLSGAVTVVLQHANLAVADSYNSAVLTYETRG